MASTWQELVLIKNMNYCNQVSVDFADHEGEDEGGGGGLDDPESDQGGRLDPSEQVHLQKKRHGCKARLLFDKHIDLQIQVPFFDTL